MKIASELRLWREHFFYWNQIFLHLVSNSYLFGDFEFKNIEKYKNQELI